jgi:hypothetical protein
MHTNTCVTQMHAQAPGSDLAHALYLVNTLGAKERSTPCLRWLVCRIARSWSRLLSGVIEDRRGPDTDCDVAVTAIGGRGPVQRSVEQQTAFGAISVAQDCPVS